MTVRLILDGGLKSCCSVTPTSVVKKGLASWVPPGHELVVVDRTIEAWTPDPVATLAEESFGADVFPLLYLDGKLAAFGEIPGREELRDMLDGSKFREITVESIERALRQTSSA